MKRPRPLTAALVLAGASAFLGACWTSAQTGDELVQRVGALERGQTQQRDDLQQEIAHAQTKVGELEEVLERATKVVTRASADTGAQVEALQQQVMALEGQLAELRNEVQRQQTVLSEQQAETEEAAQEARAPRRRRHELRRVADPGRRGRALGGGPAGLRPAAVRARASALPRVRGAPRTGRARRRRAAPQAGRATSRRIGPPRPSESCAA
ncbi:MAG: hypothetical protein M5U28_00040 [Sandaracinaceae bacterium]|nr:hypothetical protein [Sandaracinaceae bacterium]